MVMVKLKKKIVTEDGNRTLKFTVTKIIFKDT